MSLKGCIKKAGKTLDRDDRSYMRGLIEQGRPDQEIVNRLQQNILKERDEVIDLLKKQKVTVKTAESVLSEIKVITPDQTASEAAGREGGNTLIEERTSSAVSTDQEEGSTLRVDRTEDSTKSRSDRTPSSVDTRAKGTNDGPDLGNPFFGPNTASAADIRKMQQTKRPGGLFLTRESFSEAVRKLSEASPIIARFLGDKNSGLFLDAFSDSYLANADIVNVSGTNAAIAGTDGRSLDLNDPADFNTQKEILEHEIVHANTTAYLLKTIVDKADSGATRDILYLEKAVNQLADLPDTGLSDETISRIGYILTRQDGATSIAEFIAIMGAETAVSAEIYTALARKQGLSEKSIRGRVDAFIQKVKTWFDALTDADLKNEFDIDKMHGALTRTLDQGVEFREQQYEESRSYTALVEEDFKYNSKTTKANYTSKASFDYLNFAVATMVNNKIERKGKQILGNLHNILSDRFPVYVDAANKAVGIYDSSPALQQFIHAVTGERVNKVRKADVLSKFAEINAQRTEIINDQVSQLTALSKGLKDSEKADLDVFTSQMPLHDFFVANEAGDLSTAENIEAKAELLRKELWRINARAVRDVDSLVDWNIGVLNEKTGKLEQKVTGTAYNLSTKYTPGQQYPTADFQVKLRQLLALESIKRYGAGKLENLMKNEELFNVIKDNSMANVLATLDNEGTENVRDSLVMDYWGEYWLEDTQVAYKD